MSENLDPVAEAASHLRLTLERWATAKRAFTAVELDQIRTIAFAVIACRFDQISGLMTAADAAAPALTGGEAVEALRRWAGESRTQEV